MALWAGVEIASDAVRYLVLEGRGRRLRVRAHGRRSISGEETAGQILSALRAEKILPERGVRVALGTQPTQIRTHSFPRMPRRELEGVVRDAVQKDLEVLSEEMSFAWQPLAVRGQKKRLSVVVALTPREGIDDARRMLESVPLDPELLTSSSLALFGHVRSQAGAKGTEACVAVLHIGVDRMMLALLEDGVFRLVRDLNVGLDASFLEAPAAPRSAVSWPEPTPTAVETASDDPLDNIDWDALDQVSRGLDAMTQVARQIRRTLEYDARQYPDRPVKRLLLAGEASRAEAMVPLLANEVGLEVSLLDPVAGIAVDGFEGELAGEASAFAIPFALALPKSPSYLLGLGKTARARRPVPRLALVGSMAALLTVLSLAAVPVDLGLAKLAAEAQNLRQTVQLLAESATPSALEASAASATEWARVRSGVGLPVDPLRWLASDLPEEATLTEVKIEASEEGWTIRVDGFVHHANAEERAWAWHECVERWTSDPRLLRIELDPLASDEQAGEVLALGATIVLRRVP